MQICMARVVDQKEGFMRKKRGRVRVHRKRVKAAGAGEFKAVLRLGGSENRIWMHVRKKDLRRVFVQFLL